MSAELLGETKNQPYLNAWVDEGTFILMREIGSRH